ncbi:hypothetical protein ACFQ5N_00020 [Lutibacter holmesii]|uniref:Uncharacterized protein n=1 Tax=Lutibacter holmesii TaxID=1137985 RepID=A0ABW3WLY7_9FLAO
MNSNKTKFKKENKSFQTEHNSSKVAIESLYPGFSYKNSKGEIIAPKSTTTL